MIIQGIRGFVEQEIMPVRQQIDDDKDHVIVRQVLQKLYDLGLMRISLSQESDESATARGPGTVATCAASPPARYAVKKEAT